MVDRVHAVQQLRRGHGKRGKRPRRPRDEARPDEHAARGDTAPVQPDQRDFAWWWLCGGRSPVERDEQWASGWAVDTLRVELHAASDRGSDSHVALGRDLRCCDREPDWLHGLWLLG